MGSDRIGSWLQAVFGGGRVAGRLAAVASFGLKVQLHA